MSLHAGLSAITGLNLNDNALAGLPETVGSCGALVTLNLERNNIKVFFCSCYVLSAECSQH
jgi:hypothetical protein